VGFGGPIALAGHMQQDLVDKRGWISKEDYVEGLALAQLAPGPLAAQLAIISDTFVQACSRYGSWRGVRSAFISDGAGALGGVCPLWRLAMDARDVLRNWRGRDRIIARSAFKLTKLTLGKDQVALGIFAVLAISTAWTSREIIWLFLLGGVVALLVKALPSRYKQQGL